MVAPARPPAGSLPRPPRQPCPDFQSFGNAENPLPSGLRLHAIGSGDCPLDSRFSDPLALCTSVGQVLPRRIHF